MHQLTLHTVRKYYTVILETFSESGSHILIRIAGTGALSKLSIRKTALHLFIELYKPNKW